jgi:hypothetical protein
LKSKREKERKKIKKEKERGTKCWCFSLAKEKKMIGQKVLYDSANIFVCLF